MARMLIKDNRLVQQRWPSAAATCCMRCWHSLLAFAALTSAVSLLEVPVAFVMEKFGWGRRLSAIVIAFAIFLAGVPSALSVGGAVSGLMFGGKTLFDWIDFICSNVILPLGGFLATIFAGYIWNLAFYAAVCCAGSRAAAFGGGYPFLMKMEIYYSLITKLCYDRKYLHVNICSIRFSMMSIEMIRLRDCGWFSEGAFGCWWNSPSRCSVRISR